MSHLKIKQLKIMKANKEYFTKGYFNIQSLGRFLLHEFNLVNSEIFNEKDNEKALKMFLKLYLR